MGRPIRSWQDAERTAVAWMREHGFPDAQQTASGADEGIDVVSRNAVAQVKAHVVKVGRPDVQRLYGVATGEGKKGLFFSLGGYSNEARQWATRAGLPLFVFNLESEVEPVNQPAVEVIKSGSTVDGDSEDDPRISEAVGHLNKMERWAVKDVIEDGLPQLLEPEEAVEAVAQASFSFLSTGVLVLTSRRLLFIPRSWSGGAAPPDKGLGWDRFRIQSVETSGTLSPKLSFKYDGVLVTLKVSGGSQPEGIADSLRGDR